MHIYKICAHINASTFQMLFTVIRADRPYYTIYSRKAVGTCLVDQISRITEEEVSVVVDDIVSHASTHMHFLTIYNRILDDALAMESCSLLIDDQPVERPGMTNPRNNRTCEQNG